MPIEKSFGFFPYEKEFKTSEISITPIEDIKSAIETVLFANRIYDGWFYPPLAQQARSVKNSLLAPLQPSTAPLVPATRFQLPITHRLIHKSAGGEEKIDFLILAFGFVLGMRLVPEKWGHFYRTPVEEHKLSDLIVQRKDVESCLASFDIFWDVNDAELRGLALSAVNSFQMAQCYTHQFEEFLLQYITLDTIYRAFYTKRWVANVRHGARPKAICDHLNIALPDWAEVDVRGNSGISNIRNNLFHEGNVNDEPIGFGAIRPPGTLLSLQALNMRAILFLLGVDEPYTHTIVTSRQMHGLT